jgi:ribosomal protein S18 acetylase RimI-like enzyme
MGTQTISFRPARMTDTFALGRNCFPEQTLDEVHEYLQWCLDQQERGRMTRLVVEMNGQAIANGQLTLLRDRGEIGSLVVAAAYRQRGIGTALVLALVEHATKHDLRAIEISAPAEAPWIRAWYERLGFVYQGDHIYPGPERVAILHMTLNGDKKTPCPPTEA